MWGESHWQEPGIMKRTGESYTTMLSVSSFIACVYPLPLHYCQRVLCKLLIITGLWLCTVDLNFNKYFILDSIRFYDDSNCTTSSSFCSTWKPDKEALASLAAWIAWKLAKKTKVHLTKMIHFHSLFQNTWL